MANRVVETGHLSVGGSAVSALSYENWPFSILFTSVLMLIPGFSLEFLSKWFFAVYFILLGAISFHHTKKFLRPEFASLALVSFYVDHGLSSNILDLKALLFLFSCLLYI
jgi:hypothetical protein